MATLADGRLKVETAAGVRISGGKLRIYNHGTTNLTTVYSNLANTVPLANPVIADSSGVFPQVFGPEGTVVDCAMLTAGDVLISGRDFIGTLSGATSSGISLDLTNARYAVSASGGIVSIEAGDPSPDNIGGSGRLGGWAGTQADVWTADAALFNTTGAIKENSKKLPGVVYTDATVFTAAASVEIPLTNSPSGVRSWIVDIWDIVTTDSSSVGLKLNLSYDAGASYKTGASDYAVQGIEASTAVSSSVSNRGDDANAFAYLSVGTKSLTDKAGFGRIEIITPNSGNGVTFMRTLYGGWENASLVPIINQYMNFGLGNYGRADHLKLAPTAGVISGVYRVVPQRGFGET